MDEGGAITPCHGRATAQAPVFQIPRCHGAPGERLGARIRAGEAQH